MEESKQIVKNKKARIQIKFARFICIKMRRQWDISRAEIAILRLNLSEVIYNQSIC
jgi:hypothetical protein